MISGSLPRRRINPIDRSGDRTVALFSIAGSVAFLVAALLSLALPPAVRHGAWLPLHLALTGSATLAIVGVMPFFVAAFAAAAPVDTRVRFASLAAVAGGALAVAVGVVAPLPGLATAGGVAFIAGILLAGVSTVGPIRGALGPNGGIVSRAYLAALLAVTIGATLATLLVGGFGPVVQAWARLRPAHGWLNLVGFVSLVIAATLIHFFPTVTGTRILDRRTGRAALLGIAIGGYAVPLGFAMGSDLVGRLGALAAMVGAVALGAYVIEVGRRRGRWSTDPTWHLFVIGGLASSVTWFVVGIGVAGGRVLVLGADPTAWSLDTVVAPLVVGWVGLAVLASGSHMLPAIGPGDPAAHASQRAVLGRLALLRLVAADAGIALLALALPMAIGPATIAGLALVALAFGASAALVSVAIAIGLRRPRPPA